MTTRLESCELTAQSDGTVLDRRSGLPVDPLTRDEPAFRGLADVATVIEEQSA